MNEKKINYYIVLYIISAPLYIITITLLSKDKILALLTTFIGYLIGFLIIGFIYAILDGNDLLNKE